MKKTVAVDWDGTLHNASGWIPGAPDFLKSLQKRGYKIYIHSCRGNYLRGSTEIREELQRAGLKDIEVVAKPLADLYIDDRAVHCDGDYAETMTKVLSRI